MKKIFFLSVTLSTLASLSINSSETSFSQNTPKKLDGQYCEKADGIMALCISFKGDTFHYGIFSMMLNEVGKGTYTLTESKLILNFCQADSGRYVDGTIPAGIVKEFELNHSAL